MLKITCLPNHKNVCSEFICKMFTDDMSFVFRQNIWYCNTISTSSDDSIKLLYGCLQVCLIRCLYMTYTSKRDQQREDWPFLLVFNSYCWCLPPGWIFPPHQMKWRWGLLWPNSSFFSRQLKVRLQSCCPIYYWGSSLLAVGSAT